MTSIQEENEGLFNACKTYFGKYSDIMMKNNTEDIFFKVVPTKFPVIELGKAHGVRSCYIQKACMAPDYSNRNTPLVRKSAKFVICFAGPRSDVERSTGPEYITDTLRTYFPMDVISEHCDPLIISCLLYTSPSPRD